MVPSHSTVSPAYPLPQHVYVDVTGSWGSQQQVGILLEWRHARTGQRWEALVVTASGGGMTPAQCAVRWVDADHVRPRTT